MFTVFGILSILAGAFVFRQGTALTVLSSFARSEAGATISGAFLIVAICLIVSGVLACACKNGDRRGMVKGAIACYIIAALAAFIYQAGDLKLWAIVCAIMAVIYIVVLHNKNSDESTQQSVYSPTEPNDASTVTNSSTINNITDKVTPQEGVSYYWVIGSDHFTVCPVCRKRMSDEFIKARRQCPDCGCEFRLADKSESESVSETDALYMDSDTEENPLKSNDTSSLRSGQSLIWTRDEEGFTKCPRCDAYMSFDYIMARKKCPKCGQEFA